ncbi:Conserved hypothetical protein [Prochlorococcus marinus str. MIT 9303]|uniref:Uncharacterized protein n=1 Tax=Prochlorococcus marinus (strain MIT 9303) TaxID=59922 RepID=A2C8H1_PROM3|nr:Conserved hypothetical protein [Prochlorococcus marinus str. MIT 9303]
MIRKGYWDEEPMVSSILCRYCGKAISSDYQWEKEALMSNKSCMECLEKIENGELIIQRRISTTNKQCGE